MDEKTASSALHTFFRKYERVEDSEADEVIRLGWDNPQKELAIVCDIDGTAAKIDHRLHYVQRDGKKDWKSFFNEANKDEVYSWCRTIVNKFIPTHKIIMCSGKPDNTRDVTRKWLTDKGFLYNILLMRERADYRNDSIVKEIIYEFEIKPYYDVEFIIDDRQRVVDMWRHHGLTCLQCNKGDF